MSMEVPMSGRITGMVGEAKSTWQFPNRNARNARASTEKSPPESPSEEAQPADAAEPVAETDDGNELSLATANGLTLTDVRAAYDSN